MQYLIFNSYSNTYSRWSDTGYRSHTYGSAADASIAVLAITVPDFYMDIPAYVQKNLPRSYIVATAPSINYHYIEAHHPELLI